MLEGVIEGLVLGEYGGCTRAVGEVERKRRSVTMGCSIQSLKTGMEEELREGTAKMEWKENDGERLREGTEVPREGRGRKRQKETDGSNREGLGRSMYIRTWNTCLSMTSPDINPHGIEETM